MDLILWRHAEAEDGPPDLERRLTPRGQKHAARVAAWLLQRLPSRFVVLASPARRAQETARALGVPVHTEPALAPGAGVRDILAAAEWPARKSAVVIVGHHPIRTPSPHSPNIGNKSGQRAAATFLSLLLPKGPVPG